MAVDSTRNTPDQQALLDAINKSAGRAFLVMEPEQFSFLKASAPQVKFDRASGGLASTAYSLHSLSMPVVEFPARLTRHADSPALTPLSAATSITEGRLIYADGCTDSDKKIIRWVAKQQESKPYGSAVGVLVSLLAIVLAAVFLGIAQ